MAIFQIFSVEERISQTRSFDNDIQLISLAQHLYHDTCEQIMAITGPLGCRCMSSRLQGSSYGLLLAHLEVNCRCIAELQICRCKGLSLLSVTVVILRMPHHHRCYSYYNQNAVLVLHAGGTSSRVGIRQLIKLILSAWQHVFDNH